MHIAVRQREAAQPPRIVGGEDLRDGAAAVVGHQVDAVEAQGGDEFSDHPRLRGERDVLVRRDLAVAQPHEVEGDAAPAVAQASSSHAASESR